MHVTHVRAIVEHARWASMSGLLYWGRNENVLKRIDPGSANLAYLDPPYCTGKSFGAFDDRWSWTADTSAALNGLPWRAQSIIELAEYLGESESARAYLVHLCAQLVNVRHAVRHDGSIWIHVDERLVHWIRLLGEATLAPARVRNVVIWRYRRWPTKARRLQSMHDVLLWFASEHSTFHELFGIEQLSDSTMRTFKGKKQRADFSSGVRRPGKEIGVSPGPALSDVWEIPVAAPSGKERARGEKYPTQKPEALLERIIRVSTNEGDTVLDAYCGSGTTLAVADRMGRNWIGIDAGDQAISTCERRLGVSRIALNA